MEQMKCFQGNFDGTRRGLVIASSQKNAVKVVGISIHDFRNYWSNVLSWPKQELKPNTLYTRSINKYGDEKWFEGRCSLENERTNIRGKE